MVSFMSKPFSWRQHHWFNSNHYVITPDFGMTFQMFFQQVLCRELFAAGLASVWLCSTEFLLMFLKMQRKLTLKNEFISTLRAQEVLTTQSIILLKNNAKRDWKTVFSFWINLTGRIKLICLYFETNTKDSNNHKE